MSYQVIARKWRPQAFEEVTGQEIITKTLKNALEHDRLHHAYLFSGARGVGKTTTARLLAKALNCHKTDKPNLNPCSISDSDTCASCIEISESRSLDVLEIDAASHTGIDSVRETIIDSININPARDRYKVFIIDEVHQLSKPAFNALLKTLEEPPPNVVFIMATTEQHKVPETILSRCQEFDFRTIPLNKIYARLKTIAEAEKISIGEEALREIARSGEGSMRDAQSNFDQVISFSGEKISAEDVNNALGFASVEMLTKVVRAIETRNAKEILAVVDDLVARGQDMRNFCRDLLGLFRDLMVYKLASDSENLFEASVLSAAELKSLSEPFTETDILRFFNSLCDTEAKLMDATQTRYVLELGLIKLVEMGRISAIETVLERLAKLEQPQSKSQESAIAVGAEKKTLNDPGQNRPTERAVISVATNPQPEKTAGTQASRLQTPPAERPNTVKLAQFTAEDLEHIDDERLDAAFENKLRQSGDDLSPMPDASRLVEILLNGKFKISTVVEPSREMSAATAAAPALEPQIEAEPLPTLSDNPTPEELRAYAENHPIIKRALRVFQGKILEVRSGP